MLINDLKKDIKKLCIDEDTNISKVSDGMGITRQGGFKLANATRVMNDGFIRLVEAIGYDIKVEYIKREKD